MSSFVYMLVFETRSFFCVSLAGLELTEIYLPLSLFVCVFMTMLCILGQNNLQEWILSWHSDSGDGVQVFKLIENAFTC